MSFKKFLLAPLCFFTLTHATAQDYPYEETEDYSQNPASLPVEAPGATPTHRTAPRARPTSLFRMGFKAGANFTLFQDGVCTNANSSGCLETLDRSFNGPGIEGRISLGWDLAYQPLFIETEFGYQHKMMNLDSPLRVVQLQQGFFHRERVGSKSLWKNGILAAFDLRIAETANDELSYAIHPSIGFATMIEWGSLVTQINLYLSQFRSQRNHWSTSFLVGIRF
jgi:hypothetical protein